MKKLCMKIVNNIQINRIVNKAAKSIARYNNMPKNTYVYVLLLQDLKRVIQK